MPPFRAIIVGAGPVGLATGHALGLAGIDFVILERHDVVADPANGANLALWPQSIRVLDQLGLLEEARQIGVPMKHKLVLDANGKELARSSMFEVVAQNHGHPWTLFHRATLLNLLYEKLPAKDTRIKTQKEVVSVEPLPDGVRVHCADGTVEEGSIVIGCDGVHSRVRSLMRDMAINAGAKITDPESPMKAEYKGLLGYLPSVEKFERFAPETVYETREKELSFTVLRRYHDAYFFLYVHLPKPTHERRRHSDKDVQELVDKVWEHPLGEGYRVKDIWPSVQHSRVVNLEEGSLRTWHWDRIVLAGDTVCKMTPNAGLGFNNGWQGVVDLTNRLRNLLKANPEPSTALLDQVFREYQASRQGISRGTNLFSALYSRVVAWHNTFYRLLCSFAPYLGGDVFLLNLLVVPIIKRGVVLDFVEEKDYREGKIPWVNKPVKTAR